MKNFTKFVVSFVAVAALFVAANASAYSHTTLLKMGMSSSQVMELQKTLNSGGFLVSTTGAGSPGMESMYFGAKTKAAVMAFQSAKGLGADGVVGVNTGTALAAMTGGSVSYPAGCSSTTGYSTTTGTPCNTNTTLPAGCTSTSGFSSVTGVSCNGGSTSTGPLAGSFGTISTVTNLSQYNNEEVGEGQSDVKVAGFEVKASSDGDVGLTAMKVSFAIANASGSRRLEDYADTVSIWQGSTKVGSADTDDFNKDSTGNYSATVMLSGSVVKAKATEKFYISLDAVNSFDSGDIDSDVTTVDVENIRFQDGSGVITTFAGNGSDFAAMNVSIDFVSFSSASDTVFKLLSDSNSPTAGIVKVSTTDDTNEVLLLKGKIKLEGDSDVTLNSFPVTITADGTIATLVADASTSFKLVIDGNEYTESSTIASASGTVTFDDGDTMDLDFSAGETVNFAVYADINDIETTGVYPFNEGGALTASVTSTNRGNIDAENEEGDQLISGEKTGAVTGEAQTFRSSTAAFTFEGASFSAGTATSNNTGVFHVKFKVAAGEDSVYVSSTVANAVNYTIDRAGTTTTGGVSAVITNITDASLDNSVGLNEVNPGIPETFDLSVSVTIPTAGAAGQYRLSLTGIKWGTDATDDTPNNTYSANLGSFTTGYQILN